MKKTIVYCALLGGVLALGGCSSQGSKKAADAATVAAASTAQQPGMKSEAGDLTVGNVHFTRAINGAMQGVGLKDGGALEFRCGPKADIFSDPNGGKLTNNTVPMLLAEVDNTKPFTLTAKVTPTFTSGGTYNAGDLFVFADDELWQKLAFEQDERGNHRIVSVRTRGTSDDNNHEVVKQPWVYLKISSDTRTIASYYSLDGKEWWMARLYQNDYPATVWLGLATQCPVEQGTTCLFEEVSLQPVSVADFRLGV